jgi:hypothetical protein
MVRPAEQHATLTATTINAATQAQTPAPSATASKKLVSVTSTCSGLLPAGHMSVR